MINKIIFKLVFGKFPLIGHFLRYYGIIKFNYNSSNNLNFRTIKANKYLQKLFKSSKIILEYGSGNSTLYANKINKIIFSVESDKGFYEYLKHKIITKNYYFVDFGLVHFYSVPFFENFRKEYLKKKSKEYSKKILTDLKKNKSFPDLILIDGRYRVLCALQIYKFIKKNKLFKTKIIFDDYKNRKQYHIVKKFYKVKIFEDMALLRFKKTSINVDNLIKKNLSISG